jgi:hypothetical protein
VDDDGRRVVSVVGIEEFAVLGVIDARDVPTGRGRA